MTRPWSLIVVAAMAWFSGCGEAGRPAQPPANPSSQTNDPDDEPRRPSANPRNIKMH